MNKLIIKRGIYKKSSLVKTSITLPFPESILKRKEKREKKETNTRKILPSFDFPIMKVRSKLANNIPKTTTAKNSRVGNFLKKIRIWKNWKTTSVINVDKKETESISKILRVGIFL